MRNVNEGRHCGTGKDGLGFYLTDEECKCAIPGTYEKRPGGFYLTDEECKFK